MWNITRFNTIQKCINIHFGNYELFSDKIQYKDNPLLNIYGHYYSAACNNVTENNKMNETKNNERQ